MTQAQAQAQAQALSQAMVGTETDQVPAQNKLKINCARSQRKWKRQQKGRTRYITHP